MLLIVLICTGLIFVIGSFFIYNRILNPVFIILTWYISGILISHSGVFNMYKPAYGSSEFILFNILILCFTFFMVSKVKPSKSININIPISENVWDKTFFVFRMVSLLVQAVIAVNLIISIVSGTISISSIRLIVYSLMYDSNDYTLIFINETIYTLFSYFIKGFILFDISWNLCQVVLENKKVRYISLVNLLLYCFIILSRIEILRIFIIFVLIISSVRLINTEIQVNKHAMNKTIKRIIIFFTIVMLIILPFRTSSGSSVLVSSIQELIVSLNGSYVVFGNFFSDYFNGLRLINSNVFAILFGGLEPVFYILLKVIGISIDMPTSILNQYTNPAANIGASDHYNAFYTMYYNFLASGGVFGSILVSILFGTILGILYKGFIRKPTANSLLIYVFALHIIILGSIRWELSTFSLSFMLILILLVRLRKDSTIKAKAK